MTRLMKIKTRKTEGTEVTKVKHSREGPERVYDRLRAVWHLDGGREAEEGWLKPMLPDDSKRILGWEEEPLGENWGRGEYLAKDMHGKKIRCLHNTHNRPFERTWALAVAQEHLRNRWRVNGETITVGEYGNVLSGQHRLFGHVLAEQIREMNPKAWKGIWDGPVTMQGLVVYGVSEDDETVNTIDTGRPRTVADIVYRSGMFEDLKGGERKAVARMVEWCIRMLWERTGARNDPHTPNQTHAESMDFLHRHRRVLDAVKYIHALDRESRGVLKMYLTPGYASGLMYLMGASSSPPESYYRAKHRNEKSLVFSRWNLAQEFWSGLVSKVENFSCVREALGRLGGEDDLENVRRSEKEGVIIKAWRQFSAGKKLSIKDIQLEYERSAAGIMELAEFPTVGGIDLGSARLQKMLAEDED